MIKSLKFLEGNGYVSKNENTKKYLMNKTFTFEKDKVNIIFGRNGSGKSTILTTIAGHSLVKDGFLMKHELRDVLGFYSIDNKDENDIIKILLNCLVTNQSEIDMTGTPVYYHNFKTKHSTGSLGALRGDLITSMQMELAYMLEKKGHSEGEMRLTELDLVLKAIERFKGKTMTDILKRTEDFVTPLGFESKMGFEEENPLHLAIQSYLQKLGDNDKPELVLLLDEYDENLDLNYAYNILTDLLIKVQEDYNAQIILTTHNPFVLSNKFTESGYYNLISLDDEYTKASREFMYSLFSSDKI